MSVAVGLMGLKNGPSELVMSKLTCKKVTKWLPWLRPLISVLSSRKPGFDLRLDHMRSVVEKWHCDRFFCQHMFPAVSIVLPMLDARYNIGTWQQLVSRCLAHVHVLFPAKINNTSLIFSTLYLPSPCPILSSFLIHFVCPLYHCYQSVWLSPVTRSKHLCYTKTYFCFFSKNSTLKIIFTVPLINGARSWLRHCATSQKVAGSIRDDVIGIFHWHNPSGRTMALRLTQPLTEMSTRSVS